MIDAILTALGFEGPGALLAIFAAVAAVVGGAWLRGRSSQRTQSERETSRRVQQGQSAVQEGRAQGTPDERLRRNDGAWD